MNRFATLVAVLALALGALAVAAPSSRAQQFPETIPLPNGWQPEGIVVGNGTDIYSGSRATGAIYVADLRTGEGEVLVPPHSERVAIGLSFDRRTDYLFVAGGGGGAAYVYETDTGLLLQQYPLPVCAAGTFVNDVIVTRRAAYLTDSRCPHLYRIPLGGDGSLADPSEVEVIPLSGDYVHQEGFNLNGIEATPDGEALIVVQSGTGLLFKVDPETGEATTINLDGATVMAGDGMLLQSNTLYVVRNQLNLVTSIILAPDVLSGVVIEETTSPLFRVPTTIAAHGDGLYVVNARFGVTDPNADYDIVMVP